MVRLRGIPPYAWLVTMNQLLMFVAGSHTSYIRPMACIVMFNYHSISLTTGRREMKIDRLGYKRIRIIMIRDNLVCFHQECYLEGSLPGPCLRPKACCFFERKVVHWGLECMNYFVYAPSQWETTLQYNVVSHFNWLGTCTQWSLWVWLTHYPLWDVALISQVYISNTTWWLISWIIEINITMEWITEDLVDGQSTLIQVMAWCRQATSHHLNQCCPRFPTPYGATTPHRLVPLPAAIPS